VLPAALDHRAAQPGRDHKAGPGPPGLVDLRRRQDGARTDEDVPAVDHRADGILCGSGAEGHLRDGEPTRDQGSGQPDRVGGVVEHDDGDESCGTQG